MLSTLIEVRDLWNTTFKIYQSSENQKKKKRKEKGYLSPLKLSYSVPIISKKKLPYSIVGLNFLPNSFAVMHRQMIKMGNCCCFQNHFQILLKRKPQKFITSDELMFHQEKKPILE